jgi:hypothetical protein
MLCIILIITRIFVLVLIRSVNLTYTFTIVIPL